MDWGTLVLYIVLIVNMLLFSYRLAGVQSRQRHMDAKLSYVAFVTTMALTEGKPPEELRAMLGAMSKEAEEAVTFAQIAERAKPSWWRRLTFRG